MSHRLMWVPVALQLVWVMACGGAPTPASEGHDVGPAAWIHPFTGMAFPDTVGPFTHGEVRNYDTSGRNASIGYLDPSRGLVVTIYVYPIESQPYLGSDPLAGEFEQAAAAIGTYFDALQIQSVFEYAHQHATVDVVGLCLDATGYLSRDGIPAQFRTLLYLFQYGDWFIKYRATYPIGVGEAGRTDVEALIEAIRWPDLERMRGDSLFSRAEQGPPRPYGAVGAGGVSGVAGVGAGVSVAAGAGWMVRSMPISMLMAWV